MPFKMDPDARDRYLHHIRKALDRAAHAVVNTFEEYVSASAPTFH
tara:strand:- start:3628 stop:3762 length:135 start_codon:yes stop_codon:yes gene_type:complete